VFEGADRIHVSQDGDQSVPESYRLGSGPRGSARDGGGCIISRANNGSLKRILINVFQ
jgi:hypothetical protein